MTLCVKEYRCTAEANGRPVSSCTEACYTIDAAATADVSSDNWKEKVWKHPDYVFHRVSEGVV